MKVKPKKNPMESKTWLATNPKTGLSVKLTDSEKTSYERDPLVKGYTFKKIEPAPAPKEAKSASAVLPQPQQEEKK
jgi:hypothetical protein